MQYWMIYPEKKWVTSQELIDGANDAIANHNLDPATPATNAEEAMDILEDLGDITMTGESRMIEEPESHHMTGITWANLTTFWLRIIEGSKDHKAIGEAREEIIRMAGILDDAWAEKKAQEEGAS